MSKKYNKGITIIRQHGEPKEAITAFGLKVFREKELFAPEPYNTLVPCLHYSDHFIYEIPQEYKNTLPFMCTCGSMAMVVGPGAYIHDASISNFKRVEVSVVPGNVRVVRITRGFVFACMFRNCFVDKETREPWGKHADGSKG